jgi:hypothetical protein
MPTCPGLAGRWHLKGKQSLLSGELPAPPAGVCVSMLHAARTGAPPRRTHWALN